MKELQVDIEGMHCGGCVRRVTGALKNLAGVALQSVGVGKAVCTVDDDVNLDEVRNAIVGLGFSVTAMNAKTP